MNDLLKRYNSFMDAHTSDEGRLCSTDRAVRYRWKPDRISLRDLC
jgi:hypothetical protein